MLAEGPTVDSFTLFHFILGGFLWATVFRRLPSPVDIWTAVFLHLFWELVETFPSVICILESFYECVFGNQWYELSGESSRNSNVDTIVFMLGFWVTQFYVLHGSAALAAIRSEKKEKRAGGKKKVCDETSSSSSSSSSNCVEPHKKEMFIVNDKIVSRPRALRSLEKKRCACGV